MAAFDLHHPPEQALIDDCVHCGFCLPTCPTYLLWGEEMDSPRGRIYLMDIGRKGEPMTDTMVRHFDQCLGCMACVTACPSGVQYDKLIEATASRSSGATLVVRQAPPAVKDRVDVWGPPGDAFELMRAVKQRFDPTATLSPGRFVGGI